MFLLPRQPTKEDFHAEGHLATRDEGDVRTSLQ